MDDVIVRNLKKIDENFGVIDANEQAIWSAIKKNTKKIRGNKRVLFVLGISLLVVAAELFERKRCEKYLDKRIDGAVDEINKVLETQDKICDRCCQNEIKLNGLVDDFYINCIGTNAPEDGGDCDA